MTDQRHHSIQGNDVGEFANPIDDPEAFARQVPPGPGHLWWLNVETTGVDPRAPGARILELGLCCTTPALERVGLIHGYVGPVPTEEEIAGWPDRKSVVEGK